MTVGEAIQRLREAAREINTDATPSQVGLSEAECLEIADLLAGAVASEREACAKIAEECSDTYLMIDLNAPHMPPRIPGLRTPAMMKEAIASAIRGQR